MEKLVKPITVKHEEFIDNLMSLINGSGLPFFVVESVLSNILRNVSALRQQQYENDLKRYEQMKDAIENVIKEEAVGDNVQNDRKEVQVP